MILIAYSTHTKIIKYLLKKKNLGRGPHLIGQSSIPFFFFSFFEWNFDILILRGSIIFECQTLTIYITI